MWILTNFGAFMPALRPPKTIKDGDDQEYQIRARRREHLERLREFYMQDLGETYEIAHSDYEYRANVSKAGLVAGMIKALMDIDYVSFKETTISQWGDKELHDAYMRVWWAINDSLAPPQESTSKPHTYQPRNYQRWTSPGRAHPVPAQSSLFNDPIGYEVVERAGESIDDALEGARAARAADGLPAEDDLEKWYRRTYPEQAAQDDALTDDYAAANAAILAEYTPTAIRRKRRRRGRK